MGLVRNTDIASTLTYRLSEVDLSKTRASFFICYAHFVLLMFLCKILLGTFLLNTRR